MRLWNLLLALVLVLAWSSRAVGQAESPDGAFVLLKEVPAAVVAGRANVRPESYQAVRVEWGKLRATLDQMPLEDTGVAWREMVLPRPDGRWMRFAVAESPVMEPGLAAEFPDIRTFLGQGVDERSATVRFDYTPHGFHAQVFTEEGSFYIDPYTMGETLHVTSYWKRDLRKPLEAWTCTVLDEGLPGPAEGGYTERAIVNRKTYRLAVSANGEYTQFHGGTQALGQAAIVTAINRVNQIYERDLAVRFVLVTNNQNLVFTNPSTDPYSNSASSANLTAVQTQCDTIIGSANYDVGHLFITGGGGVATLNSVCVNGSKARGISGRSSPVNDPFVIDYVCHEMGHQFAGRHCFNNCGGSAGDAQQYAFEPGSGATIMAYAGICGAQNLQANSDAMFHSGSIQLMAAFVAGNACPTTTNTGNNTPLVSAGSNFAIPANTPFVLTATGSDPDGDAVTYSWEQRNTGAVVAVNTDNGTSPIQRTWLPSASPVRTIPRLPNLLNNTFAFGEILPTTTRTLNYRVVARDNRAGAGGIATSDMVISVTNTGTPFQVTSPNTNVAWSGVRTVTWNVGATNSAPINCANVRVLLSTDGGNTWPTVLLASTPNTGTALVTLPNITTTTARIKVEAINNIFFDISNVNFSISPALTVVLNGSGANTINDANGNGNANGAIDPGEDTIWLTVPVTNSGTGTAQSVVGVLSSLTPTVTVTFGGSNYANIGAGATQPNAVPYVISVSPAHPCGDPINLRLSVTSAQGGVIYNFTLPTGSQPSGATQTFSWTGDTAIPDNNATGVTIPFVVSGMTGSIADLNFRFDGATCSSAVGAPGVGLTHTWVGDLVVTLTAPGGTPSVVIIDRMGVPASTFGNDGNNFCQTVLDDSAANPIEDATPAQAPFTGTWLPNNPLSGFNGINPNGTWTLSVADLASGDTGTVRAFSVIIESLAPRVCTPPNNPPGCDPDFNGDGNVDQDDIACLAQLVAGDFSCSSNDPDFNGDGNVDQDDIDALAQVVAGGPCP